jgi:hypothetical protein
MKVRVYTDYTPVRILRGISKKDFTEPTDALALKCCLEGNFVEIEDTEIPSDRSYRNAWKVDNGAIVEDEAKVSAIDEAVAQKEVDALVAEKQKTLAIESLKVDGLLDSSGKITSLGKLGIAPVGE